MTPQRESQDGDDATPIFDEAFLARGTLRLLSGQGEGATYQLQDTETDTRWRIERALWQDTALCRAFETAWRLGVRLDPAFAQVPQALIRTRTGPVLVFAECAARPLLLAPAFPRPIGDFLEIAHSAAAALAHLHESGLLHGDIRPVHLLQGPDGRVRLAGFGRATAEEEGARAEEPPPLAEEALPFLSPEAAHRGAAAAEARSDLYALGVTFYALLTGRLPFKGRSAAEWLHAHLAMQPLPPSAARDLPPPLEQIILKLLAKDPAQRYQTAASLQTDLERAQSEWAARGAITPFPLDQGDLPRLALSEQLFGRERETRALQAALRRVRESGRSELLLISGVAGMGKSVLAQSLRPQGPRAALQSAAGKNDQHQRDIPFAPVAQMLRSLIAGLLGAPEEVRQRGRERLLRALAGQGLLVAELVSELELVIGRSPPVSDLPADLSQRRLNAALLRAFQAFASLGEPLILVMDDLQWADASSWALLQSFISHPPDNILLLGTCREGDHRCGRELRTLHSGPAGRGVRFSELPLAPLTEAEVAGMIAEATGGDAPPPDLARLLHEKTSGNPFFVTQLLRSLVDERLCRFDWASARWIWDLAAVARLPSADNVADLMVGRMRRLPAERREMLRSLACIGPHIGPHIGPEGATDLLAAVLGLAPAALDEALQPLKEAGLLSRVPGSYAFSHDRVLEAAYALTEPAERAALHRRIALAMIDLWGSGAPERAFVIAGQIERAALEGIGGAQREAFVLVLLAAARRAQAAAALAQASDYLALARRLLGGEAGARAPGLAFDVVLLDCECLVLRGDLDRASEELEGLLLRARTPIEQARARRLQAGLRTLRSDYEGAIEAALFGLRALGITLQRHPSTGEMARVHAALTEALAARPIEALAGLPVARNPEIEEAMALLVTCQASFFVDDGISFLHLAKIVELTLLHGPTPASAYGLSWFGVFIADRHAAYEEGFAYAKAALALIERHGWETARPAAPLALDQVGVWTQSLEYGLARARMAAAAGRLSGDLAMECYAWNHIIANLLAMGENLARVLDEAEAGLGVVRQIGLRDIERLIEGQIGYARRLRDGGDALAEPGDAVFAELGSTAISQTTLFWEWLYRGMAAFFFHDFVMAERFLAAAGQLTWAVPAHISLVDYHLYSGLTGAALGRPIAPHHAALEAWAALNPSSFQNKLLLIEGELARLRGEALRAMQCYEAAAAAAARSGFLQEQALAHEYAAALGETLGLPLAAGHHLRVATDLYRRWGASAKAAHLAAERAGLMEEVADRRPPAPQAQAALDIAVWIEAARALSEELVLDRLIDKLMTSMIVHAGAERGVLLLMRGDVAMVEAVARIQEQAVVVDLGRREPAEADLSLTVLRSVVSTKKPIVFDDAGEENGSHSAARPIRSVMGLPMIKQGQLIGVLYLENNLAAGIFTAHRRAMLDVLAPQAAISLEAARLYAELLGESNQRREAERALRSARAELARTAQLTAMGSLAASISHEVNQPLTGIVSNAAAGVRWLRRAEPDIEEAVANLEQIQQSGVRAAEIVRALRSLAKQAPMALAEVRPDPLIREVLALTAAEIEIHQVQLEADLQAEGGTLLADRVQLQQLVFNLIMNAVEAMGEVPASMRRLTLTTRLEEHRLLVQISDTGPGIDPALAERIFDPLVTTKQSGMGMGLAICRSITEAHGGVLEVRPTASGTSFRFSLPLAAPEG